MQNITSTVHLCTECRACEQICTKSAIALRHNDEGFAYPFVDPDSCVNCGLCIRVCPVINADTVKHQKGVVFAGQIKDRSLLKESSSGGVFSLIADYVIEDGGVVFGAAWDEKLHLHHIPVQDVEELNRLRGSKYVHSEIGNTFKEALEFLKKGRLVYYTGTPCQIAGLKLFLRKDYPNLITSDLVCHGTPSQKIFDLFVNQMEKERDVILKDYSFRDKKIFGWSCTSSSSSSIDNKTRKEKSHYYDKNMVAYSQAFIKGHITREDCYSCPFACPQRVGDITLADYWDIADQHPEFPNQFDGVSLILVNSDKGESILKQLSEQVILVPSSLEKAMATSNHNLKAPTPRPEERDDSYRLAFEDFITFRDKYAQMGKPEEYYKRAYIINRVKSLPVLHTLLKIIGKA